MEWKGHEASYLGGGVNPFMKNISENGFISPKLSADPVVPGGARQRSYANCDGDASGGISPGRCLGGVTSSFRASESDVRQFSWVVWRCVFVWFWGGFWWWFAVAEAAAWDASGGISPGRCLGGVTSSFRASESDVRQFSWVVWRCVFVWFWGGFWWWFAVAEAAAWDASGGISPGRCLGGVTSSFRASESDVRQFSWVVWRCVFVWFWGGFWWWFAVAEAAAWDASGGISPGRCLGGVTSSFRASVVWFWGGFWWWFAVAEAAAWDASGGISPGRCLGGVTSSFRASESDVRQFSWVVWRCVFGWFWGGFWWWFAVAEAAAWDASGGISPGRCLGGVTSSFRASESDVRQFSWVGFGADSDGGLPLRRRSGGLGCIWRHLSWSLPWRCNFFF